MVRTNLRLYTPLVLKTTVYDGPELFETLRDEWWDLFNQSDTATPFQSYPWALTWWKHFGANLKVQAIAIREGQDLVGMFLVTTSSFLWKALRPLGVGVSDYLHPLIRTNYQRDVAQQISNHLQSRTDLDLIDLHAQRDDFGEIQVPGMQAIEEGACLVRELPPDYERFVASLGKSLRYDVRKGMRRIQTAEVSISYADANSASSHLEALMKLHRNRWNRRGLPGVFFGKAARFHQDWTTKAVEHGWLWLSVMNVSQKPVGAMYAMRTASRVFYYQAGFDPSMRSYSPGTVLVAHAIERAIGEGIREFDFLRGHEPYKRRWMPTRTHMNRRYLFECGSPLSGIAGGWNQTSSKIEAKIRLRFEGKGLL